MHFHLPKPLHGWREFGGEVGIIVLGVLIALGAEQMVESLHWRHEVHETRKALDAELSHDLAAVDVRIKERPCIDQRLAELERWANSTASGTPLRLKRPVTPPLQFNVHKAVWGATSGEVASRMPLDAKLSYAELYDGMETFRKFIEQESDAWDALQSYQANENLDRRELHEVTNAIDSLKRSNAFIEVFPISFRESSHKLGLSAERGLLQGRGEKASGMFRDLCEPLL